MDVHTLVVIIVAVAGVWALVELALVLRRLRRTVDAVDQTVSTLTDTIAEARPVVAKLDGIVDELAPAAAQVEPLLKQATVAVEALTDDLVEVNGVLRDVSSVSEKASAASNAVSGIADSAAAKVHALFGHGKAAESRPAPKLTEQAAPGDRAEASGEPDDEDAAAHPDGSAYYTYGASEEPCHE